MLVIAISDSLPSIFLPQCARPRGLAARLRSKRISSPSSVSMSSISVMKRESSAICRARPPVAMTFGSHAQLGDHALQNAVHQPDVAVVKAALQVRNGVGADDLGGALDVHAAQPRGAREERIGADAQARRNGAAQVLALGRDHVEGGRRAEVHHDARAAVALEGGDGVHQPVRAQLGGVVHQHRHSGLDARLHKQRLQCGSRLSQTWRSVDSTGGTTEEMMMCVTWLGAMPFISKRLTKSTPYSSTVWVRWVVTRQCAASSGLSSPSRPGPVAGDPDSPSSR